MKRYGNISSMQEYTHKKFGHWASLEDMIGETWHLHTNNHNPASEVLLIALESLQ